MFFVKVNIEKLLCSIYPTYHSTYQPVAEYDRIETTSE